MATISCDEIRNLSIIAGFIPPENRPTGAAVQVAFFCLEIVLLSLLVFCFGFFKFIHPNRLLFSRLHARRFRFVVITHLGAAFAALTGSYAGGMPLENGVPCYLSTFGQYLVVPFCLFPFLVRLYEFYRTSQLTQIVAANKLDSQVNANNVSPSKLVSSSAAIVISSQSETTSVEKDSVIVKPARRRRCYSLCGHSRIEAEDDNDQKLLQLRFQSSPVAQFILICLILSPFVVSSLYFVGVHPNPVCTGCANNTKAEQYVLLAESLFSLVLLAFFFYLNSGKRDPLGTLREMKLSVYFGGIPAIFFYFLSVITSYSQVGEFRFSYMTEMFLVVFCFFQSGFQCYLAWLEHKKSTLVQLRVEYSFAEFKTKFITPGSPYHVALSNHMKEEHSLESMAFLNAVHLFHTNFYDSSNNTNTSRAKKIINTYVGDNAVLPCNFSSPVIQALLAQPAIEKEMFAKAKEEIAFLLYIDVYRRFILTNSFQEIYKRLQHESSQQQTVKGSPMVESAKIASLVRPVSLSRTGVNNNSGVWTSQTSTTNNNKE